MNLLFQTLYRQKYSVQNHELKPNATIRSTHFLAIFHGFKKRMFERFIHFHSSPQKVAKLLLLVMSQ